MLITEKLPWLKNNPISRFIWPYYMRFKLRYKPEQNNFYTNMRLAYAKKFFSQNKKRVEQVASWLCDEESKETYIRIIKFCQTRKERDYITHGPDTQYFINDFFKYGKSEVLIDCGAFDGDTIEKFIAMPNLDYQKIIAFEANRQNFEILQSKFRNNSKIVLINEGVWSKDCELYFSGSYSIGHITESKMDLFEMGVSIKVRSIDSLQIKEKVTFIKADIEGGEIEMLKGARETILRDKPRLAISIYHSNEDMVMIAEYIHALVPEYQLYVRHHQNYPYISETVLYAQIV